jgi:hypothetical protein
MSVGYWWESQKDRDHYENQDVGGWVDDDNKMDLEERMEWIGLVQGGPVEGSSEHGNELLDSLKCLEICQVLRKGSAAWI